MAIPIEDRMPELPFDEDMENCIFCNHSTGYWNDATNRPVCPQCSVKHHSVDIPFAPFNY